MKKYLDRQVKALTKNFPHIKVREDIYIIFENPSRYGSNFKDYLKEIINALYNLVSAPFFLVYYTLRYIRSFLPMLIIRDKDERKPIKVYSPDPKTLFKKENINDNSH